jgi:hypothetical protein
MEKEAGSWERTTTTSADARRTLATGTNVPRKVWQRIMPRQRMNVQRPRLCGSVQMMQRSSHVSVQTMTNTTMRTHPTAFCAESSV